MTFYKLIPRAVAQRVFRQRDMGLTDYYINGFTSRFHAASIQLDSMPDAKCVLEIGCGRDLHSSIIAAIKYKKKAISFDVNKLICLDTVNFTLQMLGCSPLKDIRELEEIGVKYVVGNSINVISDQYDAVISTASFEHIPLNELNHILKTLKIKLPVGGVFSAEIDYKDHWSYLYNIDIFNFYYLSENQYRIVNSPRMYQNRLRHSDYINLLKYNQFRVCDSKINKLNIDIESKKLANRFKSYDESDLLSGSAIICCKKIA